MLQSLNCIRMGEVLIDENLQLLILCNNCHTDIRSTQDFRQHLEKCEGLENLFQQGRQNFKYNTDKCSQLFGKTLKGIKEFLIYDYHDVEVTYTKQDGENFIDLTNIEQELLDPKWYSDLEVESSNTSPQKSSKQYDELVEAVTPFVQFKENVKSNNNGRTTAKSSLVKPNTKESEKSYKSVTFELNTNKSGMTAKRKLSIPKTVPINFTIPSTTADINVNTNLINKKPIPNVSKMYVNKKRRTELVTSNGFVKPSDIKPISTINKLKNTNMLPTTSVSTPIVVDTASQNTTTMPATIVKSEPTKEKQTAQILNKLQNLGLQVKRTQPMPQHLPASNSAPNKTDKQTLEILQRLQSKGMKVKILNKKQTTETNVNTSTANSLQAPANTAQMPFCVVHNFPPGSIAIKQNINKNLIIKKVN